MDAKYPIRFTEDVFHQFRNDYKKSSIQGTHVTYSYAKVHALTTNHVPHVLLNETEEIGLTNVKPTQVYETKQFTYASAFAGIGGMTLGLKPLGGEGVIA
ncbi:hypothetical protein [Lysinibacillus xylanilyticus]|uniref:hypothetical protein n=1 Tax=Lysinibacillus xylanilyticus TaxID=582475 RepID=UPI003CFC1CE9